MSPLLFSALARRYSATVKSSGTDIPLAAGCVTIDVSTRAIQSLVTGKREAFPFS